jgi:hypothetical protein
MGDRLGIWGWINRVSTVCSQSTCLYKVINDISTTARWLPLLILMQSKMACGLSAFANTSSIRAWQTHINRLYIFLSVSYKPTPVRGLIFIIIFSTINWNHLKFEMLTRLPGRSTVRCAVLAPIHRNYTNAPPSIHLVSRIAIVVS